MWEGQRKGEGQGWGLVILARLFNTMLSINGMSEHLYLVPNLREKAFSFSLLV